MYIETVPNRSSPPCVLLRESRRQAGKVVKRTLANLTDWPPELVEGFRTLLKGGRALPTGSSDFQITRSLPHGHVAAVLGTLRRIGLESLLAGRRDRRRDLAVAMVAARVLDPRSKLATARGFDGETADSSLAELLGVSGAGEDELYGAMDWLLARQPGIEKRLADRRLAEGGVVLLDLTSVYFEGSRCPLARLGYSRDGRRDRPQIVFGLLCDALGCPVAVEVFAGNTADPSALSSHLAKLRERFGLAEVVVVADRGLLTQARVREELAPAAGLHWITALRAPQIQKLARQGLLQPSLFDERGLGEISSPDFPGERLVVCRNPLLADERARKRGELLEATEVLLERIKRAVERPRRPLRGEDRIALRAGRVIDKYKMAKHFELEIGADSFCWRRRTARIDEEAALDGVYVIRTSLPARRMAAAEAVRRYKSLARVERAFRSLKGIDLKVRPVHHRLEDRVRAHVFLCMLAFHVEWHMRRRLAPLLFDDESPALAESLRPSPVAPARRSPGAEGKARTGRTAEGFPVHSFQTLLADLATVARNRVRPNLPDAREFHQTTLPTPLQRRAFDLLEVNL